MIRKQAQKFKEQTVLRQQQLIQLEKNKEKQLKDKSIEDRLSVFKKYSNQQQLKLGYLMLLEEEVAPQQFSASQNYFTNVLQQALLFQKKVVNVKISPVNSQQEGLRLVKTLNFSKNVTFLTKTDKSLYLVSSDLLRKKTEVSVLDFGSFKQNKVQFPFSVSQVFTNKQNVYFVEGSKVLPYNSSLTQASCSIQFQHKIFSLTVYRDALVVSGNFKGLKSRPELRMPFLDFKIRKVIVFKEHLTVLDLKGRVMSLSKTVIDKEAVDILKDQFLIVLKQYNVNLWDYSQNQFILQHIYRIDYCYQRLYCQPTIYRSWLVLPNQRNSFIAFKNLYKTQRKSNGRLAIGMGDYLVLAGKQVQFFRQQGIQPDCEDWLKGLENQTL